MMRTSVIGELQFPELGEEPGQGLAQRAIERVHRTVAVGDRVRGLVLHAHPDGGLRKTEFERSPRMDT